jgi:Flp pilus assembly protein TadD
VTAIFDFRAPSVPHRERDRAHWFTMRNRAPDPDAIILYVRIKRIASKLQPAAMIREWFNAREAIQVGTSLANYLVSAPMPKTRAREGGDRGGDARGDVQKLLQRAAKEVRPLKLNLFKRAKLLTSFKWTLLEHGFDRSVIEELTHLLLLQLSSEQTRAAFAVPSGVRAKVRSVSASTRRLQSKRIRGLLAEADALYARGVWDEAVERLQEALEIQPDDALTRNKLGAALCNLGRYRQAEREFRRAIELKGGFADAHLNLGVLSFWKGDFMASETALRRAVKLDPNNPEALVGLGLTLGAIQRMGDAKDCFERALRLKPGNVSARCGLGWLAAFVGRFEEAEKLYRDALAVDPRRPIALAAIAGLRRMTTADRSWLDAVEQTLAGGVPSLEQAKLRFAMGKYFDDLGRFARAFEQYQRANELYKELAAPYDRGARTVFVNDMVGAYTRQRLAQPLEGASDSARPVFVVGMMRSGTSLVEQIIASHPQAAGAGELDFWNAAAHRHRKTLQDRLPDAPLARKLADSYLKILTRDSADSLRVVDKATFNSDHLGLIHSVLPRARIICLRRDPVDTCLSCYFQEFASAASFTLDLSDLAHYYREHHRLIAHWRSVLSPEILLEVPYAELVADQETWSRRIIEFIGLEWNPQCLDFHKTERAVRTASSWQVRQPMYSSSIGRWRNYQKFIGPLLELRELSPLG